MGTANAGDFNYDRHGQGYAITLSSTDAAAYARTWRISSSSSSGY
jgi:hypothetical protein